MSLAHHAIVKVFCKHVFGYQSTLFAFQLSSFAVNIQYFAIKTCPFFSVKSMVKKNKFNRKIYFHYINILVLMPRVIFFLSNFTSLQSIGIFFSHYQSMFCCHSLRTAFIKQPKKINENMSCELF